MRLTRRLRSQAGDDLSPSFVSALASLDREGPLTLGELAALERVKPPSATRTVATLEERGLARRQRDAVDGRVKRVEITGDGRRRLQRSRTRKTAYLSRRIATLSDAEATTLADALALLERLLESER